MRSILLAVLLIAGSAQAKKGPPPPSWYAGDDMKASVSTGNSALSRSDWAAAEAAFREVLAKEPDCGVALLGLGRALHGGGKASEAADPLARVTALYGEREETWTTYAQALLAAGNDTEALAAARMALGVRWSLVDAQVVAQTALLRNKDYSGAHKMLAEAKAQGWMPVWDCLDGFVYVEEGNAAGAAAAKKGCAGLAPWTEKLEGAISARWPEAAGLPPAAPAPGG